MLTEEINKIILSADDGNGTQNIDYVEIYAYGTSKYIIHKSKEIKFRNIIKHCKKW